MILRSWEKQSEVQSGFQTNCMNCILSCADPDAVYFRKFIALMLNRNHLLNILNILQFLCVFISINFFSTFNPTVQYKIYTAVQLNSFTHNNLGNGSLKIIKTSFQKRRSFFPLSFVVPFFFCFFILFSKNTEIYKIRSIKQKLLKGEFIFQTKKGTI